MVTTNKPADMNGYRLNLYGRRAFSVASPAVLDSLPDTISETWPSVPMHSDAH